MKGAVKLPIDVDQWEKNTRETVRVRLDHFRGVNTIDIRAWWPDDAGTLKPGKGGFTIRVSHLPRLLAAIGEATELARQHGLIKDESEAANAS